MSGPEIAYRLSLAEPLESLSIGFGAEGYLRLFVLDSPNPADCLASAIPPAYLTLSDLAVGTYYLVVDGWQEGNYALTIRCQESPAPVSPAPHGRYRHLPAAF
jgi:hypothetical protein